MLAALAALAVPATLRGATTPDAPPKPSYASLAGQLLVASPSMRDPRFARTVILMVRHDKTGAMGLVINRPVGERALAELLNAFGESPPAAGGGVRIFAGGPVQPELGASMAMTASRDIFRDLIAGTGPGKSLFAFGYSGWGPGQLEGELSQNAWFTAPADVALVFDADRDKVWELAMERRTRDL
jgi:putative transcriptional regulator